MTTHPRVLFIGPVPPPYSGPEMGMQLFLDSSLNEAFEINHIKTNVRASNEKKAVLDTKIVDAFFRFIWQLLKHIISLRPVLAYYPITPTQVGWIGRDSWCLLICRLFGVKTVIHMRGSHFRLNYEQFHPLVRKLVRFSCKKVDLALVQAEYLRAQFCHLVPQDRIQVLYNAIDTASYNNPSITDYNPLQVLFLGHLTKAKGYCDLARAIPLVARRHPQVEFHFAGTLRHGERGVFFDQTTGDPIDHEDPFEFHDELSSGEFSSNYFYHGMVSGDEKLKMIKESAVYVSPSYSEGFSRALLEAMSMGKAMVCTPVGAHREVLADGQNACIVKPGDVGGLADAISNLLSDSDKRNTMGANNYEYARTAFDIGLIATQFREYLEQAISGSVS